MIEDDFKYLHILIIDDEAFMRKLIERTLSDIGVGIVSQATNGREGLSLLQSAKSKVDLVVCDLEMPEMNGFDFVKQVRNSADERFESTVPILILTGHADEETVRGAANLGINGYLIKPISRKSLEGRILKSIKSPAVKNN